jgi:hypothetical protein
VILKFRKNNILETGPVSETLGFLDFRYKMKMNKAQKPDATEYYTPMPEPILMFFV